MNEKFSGKVWVLGDDIDTDIIIPTEYLALKTVEDMKPYAFSPLSQATSLLQERTLDVVHQESRHLRLLRH